MDRNRNAVQVFNKRATTYQERFMDVSLYAAGLDFFSSHIKNENAEILDMACGPGNIAKYLLNKNPHYRISGIDLSSNMIELAGINNPTAAFQLMDCRHIDQLQKKYDAIVCAFLFPYLSKEEAIELINKVSMILLAGGMFYISTMEDDYSKSSYKKGSAGDKIFMYYHQEDYLQESLFKNDCKILNTHRKEYSGTDENKITDLILIAEKN